MAGNNTIKQCNGGYNNNILTNEINGSFSQSIKGGFVQGPDARRASVVALWATKP